MTQPITPVPGTRDEPAYVLLDKGDVVRVMNPQNPTPDTKGEPLNTRGYNSLIVDLNPDQTAGPTSVTVLGAPTPGGPWLQEVDPQAFQSGVSTQKRFVVTGISTYNAVALTAPVGWTVWFTPFNAASQTNVQITGTTTQNLAQYGGVAVGPSNPLDTRPNGPVDVSDRAARLLGVIASITNTVPDDVIDRAARLLGIASLAKSTWSQVGTSAANTAQTVTQAAAGAGVRNLVTGLTVSWSGGAPAAGTNVQVKDGSTVIWDEYLGQAGGTQGYADFEFTAPLQGTANTALSVTIAAAGAGVTTKVSVQGQTGA